MTHVSCKTTINKAADAVWHAIGDFGAAGQYLPGVVACVVEGAGIGARRALTSADGGTVVERLESQDGAARRLSYALLTDTPFRDCLTTMPLNCCLVAQAFCAPPSDPGSHATRSLATDLDLALPLTVISMSRPSLSRRRISRSIEKPDNLPRLSAETLG